MRGGESHDFSHGPEVIRDKRFQHGIIHIGPDSAFHGLQIDPVPGGDPHFSRPIRQTRAHAEKKRYTRLARLKR